MIKKQELRIDQVKRSQGGTNPTAPVYKLNDGTMVIVDAMAMDLLDEYNWWSERHRRNIYARGLHKMIISSQRIYMHRLIAGTRPDQVCHHRNRNSMDNRRANLINLQAHEHDLLHKNNSLQIRYEHDRGPEVSHHA